MEKVVAAVGIICTLPVACPTAPAQHQSANPKALKCCVLVLLIIIIIWRVRLIFKTDIYRSKFNFSFSINYEHGAW